MSPEVPQHSSLDSRLLFSPICRDLVQSISELPSDLEGMAETSSLPAITSLGWNPGIRPGQRSPWKTSGTQAHKPGHWEFEGAPLSLWEVSAGRETGEVSAVPSRLLCYSALPCTESDQAGPARSQLASEE